MIKIILTVFFISLLSLPLASYGGSVKKEKEIKVITYETLQNNKILYDGVKDTFSFKGKSMSLKAFLAQFQLETGVKVFFDEELKDKKINLRIKNKKLDKALKIILKDYSYALKYLKSSVTGKETLKSVAVVKKGSDIKSAREIVTDASEGVIRTKLSLKDPSSKKPFANERFNERFNKLNPSAKEKLKNSMENAEKKYMKKQARRAELEAEKKIKLEKTLQHIKERDERLKKSNPKLYELREKQKIENREKAKELNRIMKENR